MTSTHPTCAEISVAVVIAAAGRGVRMGGPAVPKQWRLLDSTPLITHCFRLFDQMETVGQIAVALDPDSIEMGERRAALTSKTGKTVVLVPGAATRQESVLQALHALNPSPEIVLVHDAARPFPPIKAIEQSIAEARRVGGAILARRVVETLKQVDKDGLIEETVCREQMWTAQTPQTFQFAPLLSAYRFLGPLLPNYTDDAAIFSAGGGEVCVVESTADNLKVTHAEDFTRAERILRELQRSGENGTDSHRSRV